MESGDVVVSANALIRIFVVLLYVPVCLIVYWKLIPRLSPLSRRLASGMLVAQILVIAVSLGIRPSTSFANTTFENWLWGLRQEGNIPATLASTQLALVGGISLLAAWCARARHTWHGLYLVAIGLVFLFLAMDEYLTFHEHIPNWERIYTALGLVLAVATTVMAARSSRRVRVWHVCLLTGLAMSALGAIVLDLLPAICDNLGSLRIDVCLDFFLLEEALEFLGIWLTLVAMLGHFSDVAPMPSPLLRRVLYSLPVVWLSFLLACALLPRLELSLLSNPASIEFESGVTVRGYSVEQGGGAARLQLYASARQPDFTYLGYGIHFIDQVSGKSVANHYRAADQYHSIWYFGPDYTAVYLQSMEIVFPPQLPTNRALWIVLTLWRNLALEGGERLSQVVLKSDHRLLDETQVVLGELVLPGASATSASAPVAVFDSGFTLDAVDMLELSQLGATLSIPFAWRSDIDGIEDYVQFLHFGYVSPLKKGRAWKGEHVVVPKSWTHS